MNTSDSHLNSGQQHRQQQQQQQQPNLLYQPQPQPQPGCNAGDPDTSGKLLLHICCAPCSVYPVSVFMDEGILFSGIFFNPNIHPFDEFARRRETLVKFASHACFDVRYIDDFMQREWEELEKDDPSPAGEKRSGMSPRCRTCYSLRLDRTARIAAESGFAGFTTTLFVSPYQNHELIREFGEKAAAVYKIPFIYRDFRSGFRQGQAKARELGLYRQKYCGCIFSTNTAR